MLLVWLDVTRVRLAARSVCMVDSTDNGGKLGNFSIHNLGATLTKQALLGFGEVLAGDAADAIFVG